MSWDKKGRYWDIKLIPKRVIKIVPVYYSSQYREIIGTGFLGRHKIWLPYIDNDMWLAINEANVLLEKLP